MLSLRDLVVGYGGPPVLDGFSAEIGPGVTWVVGDEGSGKTTLLLAIAGAVPCRGHIELDGRALAGPARVAWCDARDVAHDALSVVAFIDRLRRAAPRFDAASLERHLDGFGLRPHMAKSMFQLSTGTRRKVGLAAVFAAAAPLTLLDDPAAALDAPSVAHLTRTLAVAEGEAGRAVLVSAYAAPPGAAGALRLALPSRA